jgi:hypothetical protein
MVFAVFVYSRPTERPCPPRNLNYNEPACIKSPRGQQFKNIIVGDRAYFNVVEPGAHQFVQADSIQGAFHVWAMRKRENVFKFTSRLANPRIGLSVANGLSQLD